MTPTVLGRLRETADVTPEYLPTPIDGFSPLPFPLTHGDARALLALVDLASSPEVHDAIQDGIAEARENIARAERLGRTARANSERDSIAKCEALLASLKALTEAQP